MVTKASMVGDSAYDSAVVNAGFVLELKVSGLFR